MAESSIAARASAAAPPTESGSGSASRPNLRSRIVNGFLQLLVKRSLARRDLSELPAARARLDRLGERAPVPKDMARSEDRLADVATEWSRRRDRPTAPRTILYLHGGAYVVGSPRMYRLLASELLRACDADVAVIDYRLAPEHPYPAALDDAEASYRALLERGVAPQRLLVMGDSAGGNLTAALLLRLRERRLPMPAGAALLSPWLDLAASYSPAAIAAARDPMLPASRIQEAAALYHRDADPRDPFISPCYADLAGLPPMRVHAGTRELLLPAIEQFVAAGRGSGSDVSLRTWAHMPHVFQAFARFLPEGREALADLGHYARVWVPSGHGEPSATGPG